MNRKKVVFVNMKVNGWIFLSYETITKLRRAVTFKLKPFWTKIGMIQLDDFITTKEYLVLK